MDIGEILVGVIHGFLFSLQGWRCHSLQVASLRTWTSGGKGYLYCCLVDWFCGYLGTIDGDERVIGDQVGEVSITEMLEW